MPWKISYLVLQVYLMNGGVQAIQQKLLCNTRVNPFVTMIGNSAINALVNKEKLSSLSTTMSVGGNALTLFSGNPNAYYLGEGVAVLATTVAKGVSDPSTILSTLSEGTGITLASYVMSNPKVLMDAYNIASDVVQDIATNNGQQTIAVARNWLQRVSGNQNQPQLILPVINPAPQQANFVQQPVQQQNQPQVQQHFSRQAR